MSANTLTNILPKILARGLISLRSRCIMPRLVNSDYGAQAALKGSTIDVPVPVAVTTTAVSPSNVLVDKTGLTPAYVQVSLDQWRQNDPIGLTDKELTEIDANEHFLPMQLMEAIKALASDVNQEIVGHYAESAMGVYGWAGASHKGVAPFTSDQGVSGATLARKILNQQLCPKTDRRGVVDFEAEANMLDLSQFSDAEKIMSDVVKMEGEIGRKYGIDWVADDDVPTHTCGTAYEATPANCKVAVEAAIGATTVNIKDASNTETLVRGDVISFAGNTQTYVVTSSSVTLLSGGADVGIYPGLVALEAVDDLVTIYNTHTVNMAFHRDAFAFATRPLLDNSRPYALGSQMISMQDPITGLVLRLEVSRQHKQTCWEFDILWGSKLIRPELACRIGGTDAS